MCPPHLTPALLGLPVPVSQPRELECKNCGTKSTPFWRKDKNDGKPLCNACGLYHAKNDAPRPKMLWRTDENGNPIPGSSSVLNLSGCSGSGNGLPSSGGQAAKAAAMQAPSAQAQQQQQAAVVAAAMAQFQAAMRAGAAGAGGTRAPGSGGGEAGSTALAAALRTMPAGHVLEWRLLLHRQLLAGPGQGSLRPPGFPASCCHRWRGRRG